MKKAMSYAKEFFHRADIFLLVMGLICAIFGIVVISSATASYHSAKYVIVQSASLILGVFAFVVMTVLDVDVLADKWQILCAFNVVFLLLLIPFGVSDNTGNTGCAFSASASSRRRSSSSRSSSFWQSRSAT